MLGTVGEGYLGVWFQHPTLIVWSALLHSFGRLTTICSTIRKSIRFFLALTNSRASSVCVIFRFKVVVLSFFWPLAWRLALIELSWCPGTWMHVISIKIRHSSAAHTTTRIWDQRTPAVTPEIRPVFRAFPARLSPVHLFDNCFLTCCENSRKSLTVFQAKNRVFTERGRTEYMRREKRAF